MGKKSKELLVLERAREAVWDEVGEITNDATLQDEIVLVCTGVVTGLLRYQWRTLRAYGQKRGIPYARLRKVAMRVSDEMHADVIYDGRKGAGKSFDI